MTKKTTYKIGTRSRCENVVDLCQCPHQATRTVDPDGWGYRFCECCAKVWDGTPVVV